MSGAHLPYQSQPQVWHVHLNFFDRNQSKIEILNQNILTCLVKQKRFARNIFKIQDQNRADTFVCLLFLLMILTRF